MQHSVILSPSSIRIAQRRQHPRGNRFPVAPRAGVATTELALCLPILLLIVFGTIESTSVIFLKETLTTAAYEGARAAIAANATTLDVTNACDRILNERHVRFASITVTPADLSNVPIGQFVTVTVAAPFASNSLLHGWYFNSESLAGMVTMMKEF
jgi:hypothetical protein